MQVHIDDGIKMKLRWMETITMNPRILFVAAFFSCAVAGQASAAPVFTMGVDNSIGFQSAVNKTGGSAIAVGDLFYGVINMQTISSGPTTWNANNVSPSIDSFTGYMLTRVASVAATATSYGTFYSVQLGVAGSDPNHVFSTSDLASGAMMKLYTDTTTPYTTGGSVATDIAHATDGTPWATLGFTSASNYWSVATSPLGNAAFGGINIINNNTGLNWNKVLDTNCTTPGGCLVDMKFVATFNPTTGGAWQIDLNDPATMHPVSAVPLPAAVWLMGSGLLALSGLAKRRKKCAAAT